MENRLHVSSLLFEEERDREKLWQNHPVKRRWWLGRQDYLWTWEEGTGCQQKDQGHFWEPMALCGDGAGDRVVPWPPTPSPAEPGFSARRTCGKRATVCADNARDLFPACLELAGSEGISPDKWGRGVTPGGCASGGGENHAVAQHGQQREPKALEGGSGDRQGAPVTASWVWGVPVHSRSRSAPSVRGQPGQRTHP